MPTGLERWQDTGESHFVTFSCHHRQRKFVSREVYELFPVCLEEMRCRFGTRVYGYVVMPEQPPQQAQQTRLPGAPAKRSSAGERAGVWDAGRRDSLFEVGVYEELYAGGPRLAS